MYPRSFADANGDGTGDVNGIRARLPYLADLGVDAIWISPWYPSPLLDGGYDVSDYRDINPEFGTLADADALIAEAHALGLRILIDLVPNHCSWEHPWFKAALAAGKGSPERDLFWFRDGKEGGLPPTNWPAAFGGGAWQQIEDGQWYLHLFDISQPDWNWDNPKVIEEFDAILRFWFDRGVDGFRIDVADSMAKDAALPDVPLHNGEPTREKYVGNPFYDQPGVHTIHQRWRAIADEYADTPQGPRVFVAGGVAVAGRAAGAVRAAERTAFRVQLRRTAVCVGREGVARGHRPHHGQPVGRRGTGDLGAEQPRHDPAPHPVRPGPAGGAGGCGRRTDRPGARPAPRPGRGAARAGAAGRRVHLPGRRARSARGRGPARRKSWTTPIWERSGHTVRGRDGCRVPDPVVRLRAAVRLRPGTGQPWLPQPADWSPLTAEAQAPDPDSHLNLYKAALRIRREHPALGEGRLAWDEDAPPGVLSFTRDPSFRCVVNLGDTPVDLPTHQRDPAHQRAARRTANSRPTPPPGWRSEHP